MGELELSWELREFLQEGQLSWALHKTKSYLDLEKESEKQKWEEGGKVDTKKKRVKGPHAQEQSYQQKVKWWKMRGLLWGLQGHGKKSGHPLMFKGESTGEVLKKSNMNDAICCDLEIHQLCYREQTRSWWCEDKGRPTIREVIRGLEEATQEVLAKCVILTENQDKEQMDVYSLKGGCGGQWL